MSLQETIETIFYGLAVGAVRAKKSCEARGYTLDLKMEGVVNLDIADAYGIRVQLSIPYKFSGLDKLPPLDKMRGRTGVSWPDLSSILDVGQND